MKQTIGAKQLKNVVLKMFSILNEQGVKFDPVVIPEGVKVTVGKTDFYLVTKIPDHLTLYHLRTACKEQPPIKRIHLPVVIQWATPKSKWSVARDHFLVNVGIESEFKEAMRAHRSRIMLKTKADPNNRPSNRKSTDKKTMNKFSNFNSFFKKPSCI